MSFLNFEFIYCVLPVSWVSLYARKELAMVFLFFSIFILRANVYVGLHIDILLGKVLKGHLFLKVRLEIFPHLQIFFILFILLLLLSSWIR